MSRAEQLLKVNRKLLGKIVLLGLSPLALHCKGDRLWSSLRLDGPAAFSPLDSRQKSHSPEHSSLFSFYGPSLRPNPFLDRLSCERKNLVENELFTKVLALG